jgi:hypothetical protein
MVENFLMRHEERIATNENLSKTAARPTPIETCVPLESETAKWLWGRIKLCNEDLSEMEWYGAEWTWANRPPLLNKAFPNTIFCSRRVSVL